MTTRIGCVDVPALPLQLVLRRRRGWGARPVAVVAEDRPNALVLSVNRAARALGVATGMRYGAALSLAPDLRADVVPDDETAAAVEELTARLLEFTPGVEPAAGEPGVFFLDASGLERLHGTIEAWAAAVARGVEDAGFRPRVAVGFERFAVYAAAKTARGVVVSASRDDETRAARRTPLSRLGVEPRLLAALAKLDVRTVEDFLRLPAEGLLRRFGGDALRLARFAAGGRAEAFARAAPVEPLVEEAAWERPAADLAPLVAAAERLLLRLTAKAAARGAAVDGIGVRLALDRHPPCEESLRPAAPTLSSPQLLDLVRLRLEALRPPSGVVAMTLTATAVAAAPSQLGLFVERPRRDPAAAARAFARLRAELGEDAVVVARLADGHLPEDSFAWDPVGRCAPPRPRTVPDAPLVRRLFAAPVRVPPPGPDARLHGPYLVETRWWTDAPVARAHWFVETRGRRLSWVCGVRDGETWLVNADVG
jgi:protein ImuB